MRFNLVIQFIVGKEQRFFYQAFKFLCLIIQNGKAIKGTHVTWKKAVIFDSRFFAFIDPFPVNAGILLCQPALTLRWRSVSP